jgi:zinc and cadmium transporter
LSTQIDKTQICCKSWFMNHIFYPLLASFLISLVSFIGILSLPFNRIKILTPLLVALAAGGMIGDAFLHLIPKANPESYIWIIVGICCFYLLETALHWHHHHDQDDSHKHHHVGIMSVIADSLHNFFDGLGIAAAFAVNPAVGIATTIAFLIHEIPQELGDYAIYISSGWSRKKALLINFLSGLMSLFGTVFGIFMLGLWQNLETPIIMITAGSLIYIALADLIPESNKQNMHHHKSFRFLVFASFLLGVGLMYSLIFIETILNIH